MNELQKELQDLKAKVAELEARILFPNEPVNWDPVKWEPKGGASWINGTGEIIPSFSKDNARLFGAERETKEQAQRAAVEMRRFNRLLALRDELCGEIDESPYCLKYYVYFIKQQRMWRWAEGLSVVYIAPHFTSEESAQKACDMLNSGEVEL